MRKLIIFNSYFYLSLFLSSFYAVSPAAADEITQGHANLALANQQNFQEPSTHLMFPLSIAILDQHKTFNLSLTGVATRTKFIVKVYSIAHYGQNLLKENSSNPSIFDSLLQDNTVKQYTLKWVHDVPLAKIGETFYETFQKILTQEQERAMHPYLDRYIALYDQGAKKGDTHFIRWLPGGRIQLWINEQQKGEIINVEFAKALWSIWLGPKSIVDRHKLISLLK